MAERMKHCLGSETRPPPPQTRQQTGHSSSTRFKAIVIVLCGLAGLLWTWTPLPLKTGTDWSSSATDQDATSNPANFSWLTSPTYKHLQYAPCYSSWGEFQCARLELPLDYWNGTTNGTLSLAVIRKPAAVPITDPRYAGPLVVNPGGPGGSGIEYVVGVWKRLRHSVDSPSLDDPNGKFYDILSFDPRGVGFSSPNVNCFADPGLSKGWALRIMEEGVLGGSDATFGRLWSMAIARAGSCSLPLGEGHDIKPYATTAHTARDMLELVEHHGRWREAEARRILASQTVACHRPSKQSDGAMDGSQVPETLRYKPGHEKIIYSGGSYGTYLGLTFAAMFPDRIHRLRVDGLVDADDYRKVLWTDNLRDTEKEVHEFYYHCARAGYPACSLANSTGETTVAGVEARVHNITNRLIHNPLPVIGPNPEVITYSDAKHLIFAGLYSPIVSFPKIADLLAGVEQGNGTLFAELLRPYHKLTCPSDDDPGWSITGVLAPDATMAIACADGDDQSWMTKSQFSEYWHDLAKRSPSIGPMWAMFRMYCIHYSTRPAYRFTAPFEANTSHPILLIGNTFDPVTPLKNAFKMSKGYPGSVVLTQNSTGHTSGSVYSSCTVDHIRRYFQTGELPKEGTVCEPDELPFGNSNAAEATKGLSDEIKELYREGHAAFLGSARGSPAMVFGERFGFPAIEEDEWEDEQGLLALLKTLRFLRPLKFLELLAYPDVFVRREKRTCRCYEHCDRLPVDTTDEYSDLLINAVFKRAANKVLQTLSPTCPALAILLFRTADKGGWSPCPDYLFAFVRSSVVDQAGQTTYEALSVEPNTLNNYDFFSGIFDVNDRRTQTNEEAKERRWYQYR